jgi:hypothetical protein
MKMSPDIVELSPLPSDFEKKPEQKRSSSLEKIQRYFIFTQDYKKDSVTFNYKYITPPEIKDDKMLLRELKYYQESDPTLIKASQLQWNLLLAMLKHQSTDPEIQRCINTFIKNVNFKIHLLTIATLEDIVKNRSHPKKIEMEEAYLRLLVHTSKENWDRTEIKSDYQERLFNYFKIMIQTATLDNLENLRNLITGHPVFRSLGRTLYFFPKDYKVGLTALLSEREAFIKQQLNIYLV